MSDDEKSKAPATVRAPGAGSNVEVQFNEAYVASRGAGIAGGKGDKRVYPWSPQLKGLVEKGIVSVVREVPPRKREKATRTPPKE